MEIPVVDSVNRVVLGNSNTPVVRAIAWGAGAYAAMYFMGWGFHPDGTAKKNHETYVNPMIVPAGLAALAYFIM